MIAQNSTFLPFPVGIVTGEDCKNYIKTTNNEYTEFILVKIAEAPHLYNSKTRRKGYELHHIIPTHADGPDVAENCICLSVEDHAKAHFILHKVYGNYYDLCAYKMRKGKNQEAFDALRKANVEKMKNEKKGRFDSERQAYCGKQNRGVVKKPHTKLETVAAAMEHGMIWQHEDGTIVEILPGQCRGMTEVVDLLVFGFPKEKQEDYAQRKSKSPVYGRLNQLISGYRSLRTNKACYSAGPWRLLGVFI